MAKIDEGGRARGGHVRRGILGQEHLFVLREAAADHIRLTAEEIEHGLEFARIRRA